MGYSNEAKNKIIDAASGKRAFEEAAELWLALVTTAVLGSDKGSTIIEPTWTGYARIPVGAEDWSVAAGGEKHNAVEKVFAECTAGGGTVVGWATCTASVTKTGLIVESGIIPPTVVAAGITPKFVVGTLVFKLTDG